MIAVAGETLARNTCGEFIVVATNNTARTNSHSIARVVEVIRAHREVSRRVIAKETGLSTPSITRLVNELIAANILSITESTMGEGAGPGRPASIVTLNANHCCAIGIDVGEHVIQIALGDMSGRIQLTSRLPSAAEQGGNATFRNIVIAIRDVLDLYESNFNGTAPPLRAITVGVPGTVDPLLSKVVKAPMINGWSNFDLKVATRISDSGRSYSNRQRHQRSSHR